MPSSDSSGEGGRRTTAPFGERNPDEAGKIQFTEYADDGETLRSKSRRSTSSSSQTSSSSSSSSASVSTPADEEDPGTGRANNKARGGEPKNDKNDKANDKSVSGWA